MCPFLKGVLNSAKIIPDTIKVCTGSTRSYFLIWNQRRWYRLQLRISSHIGKSQQCAMIPKIGSNLYNDLEGVAVCVNGRGEKEKAFQGWSVKARFRPWANILALNVSIFHLIPFYPLLLSMLAECRASVERNELLLSTNVCIPPA